VWPTEVVREGKWYIHSGWVGTVDTNATDWIVSMDVSDNTAEGFEVVLEGEWCGVVCVLGLAVIYVYIFISTCMYT
jgi:hypothetical protein